MAAGHQSGFLERHILRSLLLFVLLLLLSDSVWALDPTQPGSSYIRAHFTVEEGLAANVVGQMVQSRDGFLWLTNAGLLTRFDGRHFTVLGQFANVWALALAPDGDLWLGTTDGLKQIPAAALNQSGSLPVISYPVNSGNRGQVNSLHFTRSGVLWVGALSGLYRFQQGAFSAAIPGTIIWSIGEAANGHLLLATSQGFTEWDGSRAIPHPELAAQLGVAGKDIFHVFQDSRGVTWFCTANGVARRVGGSLKKIAPWGPEGHGSYRVYEDPQGTLWFARDEGLFRTSASGLELAVAGMNMRSIYGDRDGGLWVGTNGDGLYHFKDRAVRMFTVADGLPNNVVQTVLVTHDGAVWAGFNCGGLARFDGQRFQIYTRKDGLLNDCVWSLTEDPNHDLWIGTFGGGAFRFHDGKFTQYSKAQGVPSPNVNNIIAAQDGSVWLDTADSTGITRIRDGTVRNYTMADGLSSLDVDAIHQDRTGRIWAGTSHGADLLTGDRFVRFESLPQDEVAPLGEDRSGVLYFSEYHRARIYRVEANWVSEVALKLAASDMLETEQGDLWLSGSRILHIPRGGLDYPPRQDEPVDFAPFGPADGLASTLGSGGQPDLALTPDGKLWIATTQGLAMLDLPRLPKTGRKPAIYVREVTVDRNKQPAGGELVLLPGTHHLELRFDAIELSSPEKIRLQYRLDGVDPEWLDVDPPGHAIYSTLSPGEHSFHVRACNRDGIWGRAGTVFYVIQQPYFYQTRWFLLSTIVLGLLVIAGLYQLRLHQIVARLNMQIEARVAERTRIARELHDTLLQSFSALLLRFQTVSKMLPARPEDAKQRVDSALEQASNAIAEGRDAVHELRSKGPTDNDLAQAIGNLARELLSGFVSETLPEFHVQVEGTPKNLNPLVRDEAYRIAAEALRNAIRHAEAGRIEVDIRYDEQNLRVRIRDDGKGIDPGVLDQGHAPGHWGLRGMRERAKLLGGNLEVWSKVGEGTEVELTVPAATAYAKPPSRWSVFLRSWRN